MAKRSDVTKAAKAELNLHVKGRPNKYTQWYGVDDNWCAMFVSYVCNKAGVPTSVVPKTAAVQVLYDFAKNNRRFKAKNSGYTPKGGDIMIQKSNGASHTGIVISSSGNTFATIEGNSGDAVRKCSYTLSSTSLTGFFVPDYNEKGSGFSDADDSTSNENASLCSTSIVSVLNTGDKVKAREYCRNINNTDGKYELHIISNGIDYMPMVLDSVEWSTEWIDTAGKLTFTILKDSNINIAEGNVVIFKENGNGVFYGYLFEKSKGKDGKINCTAYDQLRYFKNKDTYCYKNMKYSDVLKMIANDYGLNCSEDMADTGYAIPARIEDNESLFDILKNARELTMKAVNQIYIMYDDFGLLTIKELNDLKTDYWLTERTAEDFDYKTSIDSDVYNRIQLYKDDSTTGNREKYIYEDGSTINSWGILQKTVKLEEGENPDVNGPLVLNKYNHKSKTFTVKGCFGDIRLRGGASIFVSIDVGDTVYDKALFFITKASHSFGKEYTCDLTLVGMSEMNFVGDSDL